MPDEAVDDTHLAEGLAALRKALRAGTRDADRARKALDALAASGALGRLEVLDAHVGALRDADLSPWGLEEQRAAAVAPLRALHERMGSRARAKLLRELSELARAQGDEVTSLSATPLNVLIAPFTVEIDVGKAEARLSYARAVIASCPASAREILAACEAARQTITAEAIASADFFDMLQRAYRVALVAREGRPGDRVDLVDLLHPLALLRAGVGGWHKLPLAKVKPFPRYLLAYQLHRLRRDGALVTDGQRVELGTATGGSTRDKRRVLFIPTTPSDGQYHLSIRFTPA